MTANLDALDSFTTGKKKATKPKLTPYYSLPPRIAGQHFVLAFDQTLAHTGWALLDVVQLEKCWVRAHEVGDIKQEMDESLSGFAGNADLVRRLTRAVDGLVRDASDIARKQEGRLFVVHEMPATRGYRPDSSIAAATVIQAVCELAGLPTLMVNNQHIKTVLTGSKDATKAMVKKTVLERLPEAATMKPMNTNVSDAIAVGLTWLLDN